MSPLKLLESANLSMTGCSPVRSEVNAKLRGMLLIRLLFSAVVFLLGPILFQAYALTLYLFTGALFFLTLVYGALLKWRFDSRLFANIQIFADVLLVTLLIALTGWENSTFGFLYILPIATASLFFQLRESISVALLSSILYAAAVVFHRYRLSPASRGDSLEFFYFMYIRIVIFCMVGYLCGHLANVLKKQKEEVKELKSLRDLILSSMNSGLITTDTNNRIIYANRAAEEILGFPLARIYNENLAAFFVNGQCGSLEKMLDSAMTTRGDIKKTKPELQARTAEGKRIPIGFNLSAISNGSGDLVGKVMVFSDLTEVKELERRLRAIDKFRTAGELAAGIAHEIRNPLTSITGSIEMLAESPAVSETNAELLSVMIKESARLNRIIEEFLSYAKRGSLDMRKENLCDIINECIETLDRRGKLPESVRITLVEPTQPAVVSADRALMGQVFFNLLTNAVDAIEGSGIVSIVIQAGGGARPGGGVLEAEEAVKARRMSGYPPDRDRNVPYWSVAVTDNGPGMPPEKLSRIFEPFFTSKKDGVGIGLCIAEKIVREHNGHIDIISEEGQGTSVTVTIPTQQSRTGAEAKDDVCCEEVIADVSCER